MYFEKHVSFLVVIFQIRMLKSLLAGSLEDTNLVVLIKNATEGSLFQKPISSFQNVSLLMKLQAKKCGRVMASLDMNVQI